MSSILSIGFLVDRTGYGKTLGMFCEASVSYTFDERTGELLSVRIVIEKASVFTDHKKRDDHLRNADFLNSADYPQMVFTANGARRTGELELLGKSQPVFLEATWTKSAPYPMDGKPYAMGVSLRGSFRRSLSEDNCTIISKGRVIG